jgi:hypothetical protein
VLHIFDIFNRAGRLTQTYTDDKLNKINPQITQISQISKLKAEGSKLSADYAD